MSNGLTLTDLMIIIWAACVAGVKRAGGVGGVRKKRRREEKRRGDPFFSFLLSAPPPAPPLAPVTQASVGGIL